MKVLWNSKYKTICVYIVITAVVLFIIAALFLNIETVGDAVGTVFSILLPFIIGFAAAYLLSRPAIFIEKHWFSFIERRKPHPGIRRSLSILSLYIIVFGIFVLLIYFIIPQLFESATTLLRNIPSYLDQLHDWIVEGLEAIELYSADVEEQLASFESSFMSFTNLAQQVFSQLPTFITSVGTGIFNFFVGMIVSVYVLYSRERFARLGKKLAFAIFKSDFAEKFIDVLKYSNNVFLGYIMGTLASTAFVGVCTFFFLTLFQMPYAILITVIVSITNIIPFFGPFLGAIPSAIILLIVDPVYALIFVIFIVVLQQIDGNIVLPKLIGMRVGLSAFWVLFALLLFGGLFGFWGLVLGVPVFAVIYSLIKTLVASTLKKKDVPPEKTEYPKDIIIEQEEKTLKQKMKEKKEKKQNPS